LPFLCIYLYTNVHLKDSQVQMVWTNCPKKESGRSFNSNSSWELQVSQNLEEWFGIGIWSIFSKLYAQTTFFFPYMFHYITVRYCGYDYEVAAATVGDSEPAATSCCSSEPPCPWCELSADFIALLVLSCWTSDLNSLESLDDDFKSQAELSWPCFSHGLGFGAIRGSEIGWSGFGGSSLISYTTAEKVHKRMKLQISLVAALMEDN